jgi:hypothetical protein
VVEVIGDESGLIDNEERDGGEAANVVGDARKADEAAAVGEDEGIRVTAIATGRDVQQAQEGGGFFDPLTGLASGGGGDEDEGAGVMPSVMERADGGDGGLTELTGAAEDEVVGGGGEDEGLHGVGLKVEDGLSPLDRIGDEEAGRDEGNGPEARERLGVGVPVGHKSRRQKTEVRRQKTETASETAAGDRSQETGDVGQKTEVRRQKSECGDGNGRRRQETGAADGKCSIKGIESSH